ncbi:hypothetical protein K8S17_02300, partial [bacterium]|nr:hypothetical protein [bacterium]
KVSHHGSAKSSTSGFLDRSRPELAVIPVGKRNRYGHPDAGTVARLAAAADHVFRTDRDGAVIIDIYSTRGDSGRRTFQAVTRCVASGRHAVCLRERDAGDTR